MRTRVGARTACFCREQGAFLAAASWRRRAVSRRSSAIRGDGGPLSGRPPIHHRVCAKEMVRWACSMLLGRTAVRVFRSLLLLWLSAPTSIWTANASDADLCSVRQDWPIGGPAQLSPTDRPDVRWIWIHRTRAAIHIALSISAKRSSDHPRCSTRRYHSAPSIVAANRSRHSCSLTASWPVAAAARA